MQRRASSSSSRRATSGARYHSFPTCCVRFRGGERRLVAVTGVSPPQRRGSVFNRKKQVRKKSAAHPRVIPALLRVHRRLEVDEREALLRVEQAVLPLRGRGRAEGREGSRAGSADCTAEIDRREKEHGMRLALMFRCITPISSWMKASASRSWRMYAWEGVRGGGVRAA